MALPDSGNVEDYSEEEMMKLLKQFEEDKSQLSKPQKAAVARYNFKKSKGQPIVFRGEEGAAPAAEEAKPEAKKEAAKPAAAPKKAAGGTGDDIISLLPPELQELAKKDPKELSKEDRIKVAKAKSQAVKAQQAAKEGPKEEKKSPEEIQREKWQKEVPQQFPWITELKDAFPDAVQEYAMQLDKPYVVLKARTVRDVLAYARDRMGFKYLACLTAADYPPDRMEVIYNLYDHEKTRSLAAKVITPREDPIVVPSVTPLFAGANWLEREILDLFGIQFEGHPDPRRLMMPEGWTGHPLRKDYDVTQEQYIAMDEAGNDVVSFKEEEGW